MDQTYNLKSSNIIQNVNEIRWNKRDFGDEDNGNNMTKMVTYPLGIKKW